MLDDGEVGNEPVLASPSASLTLVATEDHGNHSPRNHEFPPSDSLYGEDADQHMRLYDLS